MENIRRFLGLDKNNTAFDLVITETSALIKELSPSYVYAYFDIEENETGILLKGADILLSGILAKKHFSDCKGVIVLLATLGLKSEIIMRRTFALSAEKGLVLDAVFSDAIEKELDRTEKSLSEKFGRLTTRISCGYGDLPIILQKPLFDVVGGEKIGVSINECFMLTPNKSVLALIGVK